MRGKWHVGQRVRVLPHHGTKDDLDPWMELVDGVIEYTGPDPSSVMVKWKLPDDPPYGMARHPSIVDNYGWWIRIEHLRPAIDKSTHEAW